MEKKRERKKLLNQFLKIRILLINIMNLIKNEKAMVISNENLKTLYYEIEKFVKIYIPKIEIYSCMAYYLPILKIFVIPFLKKFGTFNFFNTQKLEQKSKELKEIKNKHSFQDDKSEEEKKKKVLKNLLKKRIMKIKMLKLKRKKMIQMMKF